MSEKPILFSAPMVRALLAGTKTQTRRVASKQPIARPDGLWDHHDYEYGISAADDATLGAWMADFQRIQLGDRLWVRETFTTTQFGTSVYRADARDQRGNRWTSIQSGDPEHEVLWKPSIHMPREFSRVTLTVTDVRVQRLLDISEEDARAEGIVCVGTYREADSIASDPLVGYSEEEAWSHDPGDKTPIYELPGTAKSAYRRLWDSINGPGSWVANPWVAAYTFTVALGNIDDLARAA